MSRNVSTLFAQEFLRLYYYCFHLGFFCAKGCKKRTPSFVAFSDTQVNCLFRLFSGFFSILCACL